MAPLACGIGKLAGHRMETLARREVDDPSASASRVAPGELGTEQSGRPHVYRVVLVEPRGIKRFCRGGFGVGGIVDQDVEAPEEIVGSIDQPFRRTGFRKVNLDALDAHSEATQIRDEVRGLVWIGRPRSGFVVRSVVSEREVRAGLRELPSDGSTNSGLAARTCNQRDFVVKMRVH